MQLQPLRQQAPIDVVDWTPDPLYGVFPVGARAKEAVFSPEVDSPILKPGRRYLFKKSKKSYPDQFWGEVIAYRIGCCLGVAVPPAFYAINSGTNVPAALIEWFYDPDESFMHGGDFLERLRPGFDREVGTQHNLEDIRVLSMALRTAVDLTPDWRQWWADALMFDALIGNTDRHQDNWGVIFFRNAHGEPAKAGRMAPLFDNGTSLGHERFPHRVSGWDEAKFNFYVNKGQHHVKWSLADPEKGHLALLARTLTAWPNTIESIRSRLNIEVDALVESISDLLTFPGPVPLSLERFNFIVRLLALRLKKLKSLVDDASSLHS